MSRVCCPDIITTGEVTPALASPPAERSGSYPA
jgi:hypothetical protein